MQAFLNNSLYMLGYGLTAVLVMAVCLGLLIKLWDLLTPVNEWEEIKKGNVAVAIVLGSVIIGFSIVVGLSISQP